MKSPAGTLTTTFSPFLWPSSARPTGLSFEILPSAGWVEFEDLETGQRRLARTSSRAFRAAYRQAAVERRRGMEKMLRATRCGVVDLATDQSYLPVLLHYFAQRARGRR